MLGFRLDQFKMVAIVFLIFLFTGLCVRGHVLQFDGNGSDCTTPSGVRGICRNLKYCKRFLVMLVENRSNPNSRVIELLRRSHCGFDGLYPIVCCPVEKNKSTKNEGRVYLTQPQLNTQNDESCGLIQDENRVFGGTAAGLHEFPWMALIGYKTRHGVQYRCGGSLVSSRYILTAAHCVSSLTDIYPTSVRLGEHTLSRERVCNKDSGCSSSSIDVPIEKIIPHPCYYKPELRNDIALIKLAHRVEIGDSIRPICLPSNARSLPSTRAIVTGWGTTETGIKSQVLLKASLPIVPQSECAKIYKRKVPITVSQICAGGEAGKDSCSGDSGGPLQMVGLNSAGQPAYIQHGVVSFGSKNCGTEGTPGVYTRVAHYTQWILENIKE